MSKRTLLAVGGLIAWTLFVWIGRLRNIFADDGLAGTELVWRVALAGTFTVLGIAAAIIWAPSARVGRPLTNTQRAVATALAGFSIVVWVVRGVSIALADHELGFVIVHTVLAIVSITLGVVVLRTMRPNESNVSPAPATASR